MNRHSGIEGSTLRQRLIAEGLLKPAPVGFDPSFIGLPESYTLRPSDVVLAIDDEGRRSAATACAHRRNTFHHLSAIEQLTELLEKAYAPRRPLGRMVGFERNG